jgi:small subunit ribosomal protein S6
LRRYETATIWKNDLTEADLQKEEERFVKVISSNGGRYMETERWGKRDFAYPIAKQTEGIYWFIQWAGDAGVIEALDKHLKLNDRCLRHVTLRSGDAGSIEEVEAPEPTEPATEEPIEEETAVEEEAPQAVEEEAADEETAEEEELEIETEEEQEEEEEEEAEEEEEPEEQEEPSEEEDSDVLSNVDMLTQDIDKSENQEIEEEAPPVEEEEEQKEE